jgi:uncharacterized protein YqfB (UPF0267 family)
MDKNIEDIHYNKYIKYKKKYLELKQSGGMFFKSTEQIEEEKLYDKDLLDEIKDKINDLKNLYLLYKKTDINIADIENIKTDILNLLTKIKNKTNINELDEIIEIMDKIYPNGLEYNNQNNINFFNNFKNNEKFKNLQNYIENNFNKFPLLKKIFILYYKFFKINFVSPIVIYNNKLLIPKIFKTKDENEEEQLYGIDLLKKIILKKKELKNILYIESLNNEEISYISISKIKYVKKIILDLLRQIKEKITNSELDEIIEIINRNYPDEVDNKEYYEDKNRLSKFITDIKRNFKKLENISKFPLLKKIFDYYYKLLQKEFYYPNTSGPVKDRAPFLPEDRNRWW